MIHFILGRAGFGKTTTLFEYLEERSKLGDRCLLITPEQASFEMEKRVAMDENLAEERIEVLNFTRLTRLCFNRVGGPDKELLSPMASFLLMSLALEEMQDLLNIYQRNYKSYGFISRLVETGGELRLNGIDPQRLAELSYRQPEGYLRDKSYELSLILDTYHAMMSRGFFDENDALEIAADKLTPEGNLWQAVSVEGEAVGNISLFFDGFSGFTAPQYKILRPLLAQATAVYFTLPFDGEDPENPVFQASKGTLSRLKRLSKELSIEVTEELLSTPYRFEHPALVQLEQMMAGKENGSLQDGVFLYQASDGYDELEWVAGKILALVREEGYRYKDFVVIPRLLDRYHSFLGDTFERYGIPFYLDERKDNSQQMSVKWMLLCGELMAKGINTPLMLECLKSPILNLPPLAVGELENYLFVWSITGNRWKEEFLNHPDGLVEGMTREVFCRLMRAESLRKDLLSLLSPLIGIEDKLTGREYGAILYSMFTVRSHIRDIRLSFQTTGRYKMTVPSSQITIGIRRETALRHGFVQVVSPEQNLRNFGEKSNLDPVFRKAFLQEQSMLWEQICQGLDLFATIIDQAPMSKEKLWELLELVAAGFETAAPPPTLDQVLVGTADRIRPTAPKVVFVIGAVEGEYPPPAMIQSLFTQGERLVLWGEEQDLFDTLEEMNAREKLYCYTAICSGSKQVFISYPSTHSVARELLPAECFRQAQRFDAQLSSREESNRTVNIQTALYRLSYLLSADPAKARGLSVLLSGEERADRIQQYQVKQPFQITNPKVARKLFGEKMRLSPSRVDQYNRCPFSYFVAGGLKIYPRTKAEITPLASGSLIHKVLESVVTHYGGRGIANAEPEELKKLVFAELQDYLSRLEGGREALSSRTRYLFLRLGESIYELVLRLGEEFAQSAFQPVAFEEKIGEEGDIPPFSLQMADGSEIQVVGTIDRVDIGEIGGKKYIRVVDYKSGGKKFALSDVYYGLNMQMLIYLFSIWKEGKGKYQDVLPAGVLYMPVIAGQYTTDRRDAGKQLDAQRNKHYRMNGLLLAESEVLQAMDVEGGIFIPKHTGRSEDSFATLEELGILVKQVQQQLALMADHLLKGQVQARPTITLKDTPCNYCDYRNICGFEDGDPVRERQEISRDLLLKGELLEKEAETDV